MKRRTIKAKARKERKASKHVAGTSKYAEKRKMQFDEVVAEHVMSQTFDPFAKALAKG